MDLIGKTKEKCNVYSKAMIDDEFTLFTLEQGEEVHLVGAAKYGLARLYKVAGGGYIVGDKVQIVRDLDFYYSNYSSQTLMPRNINMNGKRGLSAINNPQEFTSAYMMLTRFGLLDGITKDITDSDHNSWYWNIRWRYER